MSSNIGQQHRVNPNSLANLCPKWEVGKSGNPGGRPKGTPSIGHAYARLLALSPAQRAVYDAQDGAEEIALAQIKEAVDGEVKAAKEITDRVDGPVEKRHVIEDAATSVCSKAVESFAFYSQLNDKYAAKYGVSLTRAELLDSIVRPLAPQHQQIAVDAIDEAFPQTTEDHQLESIP